MTLDEFRSLCEKEYKECRGEIITLWLTEDSYKELNDAALMNGMRDRTALYVRSDYADLGPAHPAFNNVVNPVTGNPVRLRLAKDNVADIFIGNTGQMYSRSLEMAEHE